MKNLLMAFALAGLSGASFAALTGNACTGTAAAGKYTFTAATDSSEFVKRDFAAQCSANVNLSFNQSAVALGVASASSKGKTYFSGSSEGGAVTRVADCPSTGCKLSELPDKAMTAAGVSASASVSAQ